MWIKLAPYIGGLLLLSGTHFYAYSTGKHHCELSQAEAVSDSLTEQNELVNEHERQQAEVRIVYKDRIKKIYVEKDDGCLDATVPDSLLDTLDSRTR